MSWRQHLAENNRGYGSCSCFVVMKKWYSNLLIALTLGEAALGCVAHDGTLDVNANGGHPDGGSSSGGEVTTGGGDGGDTGGGDTGGGDTGGGDTGGGDTGGASAGGSRPTLPPEPQWWDACTQTASTDIILSTDANGCQACRVLTPELEPQVFRMELVGSTCGGPGFQLGRGWIGCGWVLTRALGDQGDGPYEGTFRIVDDVIGLGGAAAASEDTASGGLFVYNPTQGLLPQPPFECRYAIYGEEVLPTDCDSWKQVCCPAGEVCDEALQP